MASADRTLWSLKFPAIFPVAHNAHRTPKPHSVGEFKAIDPSFDVRENLWLHGPSHRQVAEHPVKCAHLDVLPRREFAPQAAHAVISLKHERFEPELWVPVILTVGFRIF